MPAISRANESSLSADHLRSVLSYDPETGIFRRRSTGNVAGYTRPDGRHQIRIGYISFLTSRLAWLYVYGEWPERQVDHIDRDKSNDAIANLRQATSLENHWNSGIRKNHQVGFRNIRKHKKRFVVQFIREGRSVYRESFKLLGDAVQARNALLPVMCGAFTPSSPDI